ncbi:hypothetical protein CI109_104619 [Kwoniella shandongensis]|uniref:Uncharacterized protein n=1 Tax=Kwoniella shandongensis TaxID=1734106 RepID=A0A5M6BVA3_9TREE|nr:uncharacterized protein CI109_004784 [Kwoniella shandongensis]KAA5526784.1 hypothetical protein CI109_004784 [Kwoniella shandongensis]
MAAIAAAQPHHFQQQQQYYPSQSVMEDSDDADRREDDDDEEDEEEDDDESIQGDYEMDPDHAHFYHQQQQQAIYYQQHQQQKNASQSDGNATGAGPSTRQQDVNPAQQDADEEAYSDEGSDTDSMPDENIDFSLTYALHTFLATVEGQASVVKGDSLVLLDDANSYWWLVRVLKTEDVGYIPAENIETPYERLARLNKHRNVDLAAATQLEKQAGAVQGRERLKGLLAGKAKGVRMDKSGSGDGSDEAAGRRVVFAPPTYVDHPGVTWSSDEEDESGEEGEYEVEEVERNSAEGHEDEVGDRRHEQDVQRVEQSLGGAKQDYDMEPDDGVEWADGAGMEEQKRVIEQKQQAAVNSAAIQPKSNNPFAPRVSDQSASQPIEPMSNGLGRSVSATSLNSNPGGHLDPAQATNDTRRITATPAVASGPLLPSAIVQQSAAPRNVSGQSVASVSSALSASSSVRSGTPTSPEDPKGKVKKGRKSSKEDLEGGEKKKRGMLGGLFSRKGKDKSGKGISGGDTRSSEESMVSGAVDVSPASQGRYSEDTAAGRPPSGIAPRTSSINLQQQQGQQPAISAHSLRLQQQDQARMQSYTSKYLNKSPTSDQYSPTAAEAAAAVAQSAAAMRLTANMNGGVNGHTGRPSSIIVSPNPAGPPLLNVIRIFAGDHIKSDASFKTALINETTSSADLIRQAMQRFRLPGGSNAGLDSTYYITVKDYNGEEMELTQDEKPLAAFQEAVQRWANESDENLHSRLGAITPTVKRSSVSSISSVISLSSHPAIAKLGMNDFSDDSAVKIYLNRRRPMSVQMNGVGPTQGMPEPASEFSSYSTQLSTVQESSPESHSGEWAMGQTPPGGSRAGDTETGTMTPPTPQAQPRFNPSLTVSTNGPPSPERYSSPSARFTLQLIIHPSDLPDSSAFDPSSEAIVPRALLQQRQVQPPIERRKRLFMLPRNANVVDAIEQGLDRFGIPEGVVDGGDDIEDKVGKRRSMTKVRYSLAVLIDGEERALAPSSKVLDAYTNPPNLKPMERTTPEQRRRSRDLSLNAGSPADILPSDPVFVLRRVQTRGLAGARVDGTPRQAQTNTDTRSPAEIIAAQRAASRANQIAMISAHANKDQGVDIVVPDRGTFRSSRLMEANGEVVRYSYIDDDGETYDISDLLEEEWRKGGETSKPSLVTARPPGPARMETDQSVYHTAPSTPEAGVERLLETDEERGPVPTRRGIEEEDILRVAVQRQEGKLEEKLNRVINKVKSGSVKGSTSSEEVVRAQQQREENNGRQTPNGGRSTPQQYSNNIPSRSIATSPEGRPSDPNATPRASDVYHHNQHQHQHQPRSSSRQADIQTTAVSVNRIISRHRQQPSIASILSDVETSSQNNHSNQQYSASSTTSTERGEHERDDGASTPVTATSSTHPTPPISGSGAIFTRAINSVSPTPTAPVSYRDDFGMKAMMAVIEARARELRPPSSKSRKRSWGTSEGDEERKIEEAESALVGEKVDWEGVHPEIKGCFEGLQKRLASFDKEIDELLASVGAL